MKNLFRFEPSCKVVTAEESARIEKLAIFEGASEESFMQEAGKKVAKQAVCWVEEKALHKNVTLLVGKGNNGGDAFAAGGFLLEKGYRVRAVTLYEKKETSPLSQKNRSFFLEKKGEIVPYSSEIDFSEDSLLLDGLLGTGFKGKLEGQLASVIEKANRSEKPILAIDIPSGLNGTTGEAELSIQATFTVTLGLAKSGLFLREGWNRVGELYVENFGLREKYLEMAEPLAYLPSLKNLKELLPPIQRVRHKYQAGYVVGFAGSSEFKGAPKMSGLAALRSGAGIVRIFHLGDIGETPPELITEKWDEKRWKEELKRAKAVFIGPGLGKTKELLSWLKKELKKLAVATVFDAEALQKGVTFPKESILTPHKGEMLRLLGYKKEVPEELFLAKCQEFTRKKQNILILKGAPTFIFSTRGAPVIIPRGDPGMATAGSGDVLTGILAALLAQGSPLLEAAVLGAYLHAVAGEKAAKVKTSYGEIAGDLIEFLPKAFQSVMSLSD